MLKKIKNSPVIKSFSFDFGLSLVATFIPIGIMQLFLYPQMAKVMTVEVFGTALTVMGVVSIIAATFASGLGYTRMIANENYQNEKVSGDFNLILIFATLTSIVIVTLYNTLVLDIPNEQVILIILLMSLMTVKAYYATAFRLNINYINILVTNLLSAVGYILGILLIYMGFNWPIAFICAEVMSLTFVMLKSDLWREPFKRTKLLKGSLAIYYFFVISAFLNNLLSYLDRIIIYPMLGSEFVSIYNTAAFMGKSIALVMLPISGVYLSYLVGDRIIMTPQKYRIINFGTMIICMVFIAISLIFGEFLTGLIYPTLIKSAMPYLILANIASILSIAPSISSVIVLKLAPAYWQVILSATGIILYGTISYFMLNKYGLLGFCWGLIIVNLIRAILTIKLGAYYTKMQDLKYSD